MHIIAKNHKRQLQLVHNAKNLSHGASVQKSTLLPERLYFSSGNKAYRMPCDDVIYCKSDSNYCHIIGRDKRYFICQTLKWVLGQLPISQFIRVHHQYVVNTRSIISLDKRDWNLEIHTGEKIPVSRSNRAAVARLFQEY